jgi:hypothetical protein
MRARLAVRLRSWGEMTADSKEAAGWLGIPLMITVTVQRKLDGVLDQWKESGRLFTESSVKVYQFSFGLDVSNRAICQQENGCTDGLTVCEVSGKPRRAQGGTTAVMRWVGSD